MRRTPRGSSLAVAVVVTAFLGAAPVGAQEQESPAEADDSRPPMVRMARATWDTGWFQAEIYRQLMNRLGYRVEGPMTMENQAFYDGFPPISAWSFRDLLSRIPPAFAGRTLSPR